MTTKAQKLMQAEEIITGTSKLTEAEQAVCDKYGIEKAHLTGTQHKFIVTVTDSPSRMTDEEIATYRALEAKHPKHKITLIFINSADAAQ